VEASTLTGALKRKLIDHDLLLVNITSFEQQRAVANIGRLYSRRHLFPSTTIFPSSISFIGGGAAWGEAPNWAGEIGFVMLRPVGGDVYQAPWHGHIPIERHDDGLWCLLFGVTPSDLTNESPAVLANTKANRRRLNKLGQSFDTWIRFDVLERLLVELVADIDCPPCMPIENGDTAAWLRNLPAATDATPSQHSLLSYTPEPPRT